MTDKTPKKTAKIKKKPTKKVQASLRVDGLLPKQAAFVREYLLCGNATQAALAAGYSPKTARVIGQENLQIAEMELTKEKVAREIARISFFDPRKMFAPDGRPLAITELDSDTAATIIGLDVLEQYEGSGDDRRLVGLIKAKILGMFGADHAQQTNPLASLLHAIAGGNSSAILPVSKDPAHED